MLLPVTDGEDDEEEEADPRAELVRRLLEYQRFKDAADQLEQREILTRDVFVRSAAPADDIPAPAFREVSVFELLTALKRVLDRLPKDAVHEVLLEKVTVREKMALLLDRLRSGEKILFESLFAQVNSRMEVVVTFLAMLELVKIRAIRIFQEEATGPIQIEAAAEIETAPVVFPMQDAEENQHGS
jgi:segregation and condensation protein A